jgi:cell division protein FtsW (lipid II flippase)
LLTLRRYSAYGATVVEIKSVIVQSLLMILVPVLLIIALPPLGILVVGSMLVCTCVLKLAGASWMIALVVSYILSALAIHETGSWIVEKVGGVPCM